HRLDVVACEAPVALGVEVAEVELVLEAQLDARGGPRDLAGHEGLAAAGALVVEEDAVRREHPVGLAVVLRDVERVGLRGGVGAARMKGGELGLRDLADLAVELARGGLIEARLQVQATD